MDDIESLILCGGKGKRLRSVIADRPKVLSPVNGRPFLSYILEKLIEAGFYEAILCTGYKAELIREAFGSQYKGLKIRYSDETEPLGTGGAVRNALPMIDSEIVLIMNGDSYIDIKLLNFICWFNKNPYDASILLTKVPDTSRYGRIETDITGRILHFGEKLDGLGEGWINAGIYLIKKSLLEMIPKDIPYSLETEFSPYLVNTGFYGYHCERNFIDIGTPESYEKADYFFKRLEHGDSFCDE